MPTWALRTLGHRCLIADALEAQMAHCGYGRRYPRSLVHEHALHVVDGGDHAESAPDLTPLGLAQPARLLGVERGTPARDLPSGLRVSKYSSMEHWLER
jgi:hypothetical protein